MRREATWWRGDRVLELPPLPRRSPAQRAVDRTNPLLGFWRRYVEPFRVEPFKGFSYIAVPGAGLRAHAIRRDLCHRYAFAIPSDEALDLIAPYSPIVEIGAGTGYWAHLLRQRGAVVRAYDVRPRRRSFAPVLRGRARKAKQFSDHALMLCWPPLNDPMAANALALYRGSTVIYIGEDAGGCCATDAFFEALEVGWRQVADCPLPQWDGIHDTLSIWRRR